MNDSDRRRCGWVSDLPGFYRAESRAICVSLEEFIAKAGAGQFRAWDNMVPILQREFGEFLESKPAASEYSAVLEYELPREGGRRPDVIVLENGVVVVLEFKDKNQVFRADLDQANGYAKDLQNYHSLCRDLLVEAVLVPTRWRGERRRLGDVTVCPPSEIDQLLFDYSARATNSAALLAEEWLEGEYAPLPTIVKAARDLFHHQELPRIRRAHSARLPEVHALLTAIAHDAALSRTRHLVLLTGVPGSGKTLAGLQFVHSKDLDDLIVARTGVQPGSPAVFLSGNGPLVAVLQHALGNNKTFVQDMKRYVDYYGFKKTKLIPSEHVVVFDEAQRAWDAEQVNAKHGQQRTEPEIILSIASRIPEWCVVLGLVGEGQEIHRGEEAGLAQWSEALGQIDDGSQWVLHGPAGVQRIFRNRTNRFEEATLLNLSTSLRSHLAADLHAWVRLLLECRPGGQPELAALAGTLRDQGFDLYLTRDVEQAKEYARTRYLGHPDKRYGFVASSKAKNLQPHGIDNDFQATKRLRHGPWYNDDPGSPNSCCALAAVATEFACQGLELDFPLVCWGDDLWWGSAGFESKPSKAKGKYQLKNPHQLRVNAYRVLLTRGRDGMCVFVPPGETSMDATAGMLLESGCDLLLDPIL
jgi:hypothetical protein